MIPRAKAADHLTVDAAKSLAGTRTYVRVAQYKKGHLISPSSPDDAKCGDALFVDTEWWDTVFRPFAERYGGSDPGEWYIALDSRKGDKCAACGSADLYADTEFKFKKAAPYEPPTEQPVSTPAQRLEAQRNNAAVSRIAREFDAEILHGQG